MVSTVEVEPQMRTDINNMLTSSSVAVNQQDPPSFFNNESCGNNVNVVKGLNKQQLASIEMCSGARSDERQIESRRNNTMEKAISLLVMEDATW